MVKRSSYDKTAPTLARELCDLCAPEDKFTRISGFIISTVRRPPVGSAGIKLM